MRAKKVHRVRNIIFVVYVIFVLWYTVFSRIPTVSRSNFRLFWALEDWIQGKGKQEFLLYLQNIVFFIPYGFFYPRASKGWKEVLFSAMLFSAFIEAAQYYAARGLCELDDIIANTSGAEVGFWLANLLYKIIPSEIMYKYIDGK